MNYAATLPNLPLTPPAGKHKFSAPSAVLSSPPAPGPGSPKSLFRTPINPITIPGASENTNGSKHAYQDYQLQLMRLEQVNGKRLQKAREEMKALTIINKGSGGVGTARDSEGQRPPLPPSALFPDHMTYKGVEALNSQDHVNESANDEAGWESESDTIPAEADYSSYPRPVYTCPLCPDQQYKCTRAHDLKMYEQATP